MVNTIPQQPAGFGPYKSVAFDEVTFTVGAQAAGNINVGLQFKLGGVDVTEKVSAFAYLSDDSSGNSVAGTAPDGNVAVGTDGVAVPVVADKAFHLVSEDDGDVDLDVGEAGQDTWYLAVVKADGGVAVSDAIAFTTTTTTA